jgi:serine/threonine protein kinase
MPWLVPGYRPREDLAGGTGRVVLATDESSGELVVIKSLDIDSSHTSDDLRSAIDGISGLPDDYFVRIRELVQDSGHNAIVMDALNGTTMRALIRDDGRFGPESALILFRDVLTGLTYAHALDIVHGDLSPENVMIDADGRPVLLNTGAATWNHREPTLSSGVYLAPELWQGGAPTAAADVYAATVGFVESLTGEPPYWEDTDLDRLRRRHASEDADVAAVPVALHDVVRAGMAKTASERMSAAALLDLVETAAIAGYGRDWPDRGRQDVIQRVRSGSLPFGGAPVPDAGGDVRDTEDAANDDYYVDAATADANAEIAPGESPITGESRSSDESPATDDSPPGPPSGEAAADAVMAAAAEIVAFAQLRDSAEADAILAASMDEDLTEEEESAVAEIERLLFLDEELPGEAEAASSEPVDAATGAASAVDTSDATADPTEAAATTETPARTDAAAGTEAVAGTEAAVVADAAEAGTGTEAAAVGDTTEAAAIADVSEAGAGTGAEAAAGAEAEAAAGAVVAGAAEHGPASVSAGTNDRRPRWLAVATVAAGLVVAGLLAWAAVGLTGSSTRPAAASSRPVATSAAPAGTPSASVPASAGAPPIGSPTGTSMPTATSPSTSASSAAAGVSGTGSAAPTLPLTGFEHPIRLMAAIAAAFILAGALLLYAGRRRDDVPPGRQFRARTPTSG